MWETSGGDADAGESAKCGGWEFQWADVDAAVGAGVGADTDADAGIGVDAGADAGIFL